MQEPKEIDYHGVCNAESRFEGTSFNTFSLCQLILIRYAVGGPGPKGGPETEFFALRGSMNHTIEVLKEPEILISAHIRKMVA